MAKSRDGITIRVHRSYFDNIFEPQRRSLQNRLGKSNLSQVDFTEFLSKSQKPITNIKMDMSMFGSKKRFRLG